MFPESAKESVRRPKSCVARYVADRQVRRREKSFRLGQLTTSEDVREAVTRYNLECAAEKRRVKVETLRQLVHCRCSAGIEAITQVQVHGRTIVSSHASRESSEWRFLLPPIPARSESDTRRASVFSPTFTSAEWMVIA